MGQNDSFRNLVLKLTNIEFTGDGAKRQVAFPNVINLISVFVGFIRQSSNGVSETESKVT